MLKETGNILNRPDNEEFVLRLFITGASPNSARAISNIRKICELHLKNRYSLEIIDVYQQPERALVEQLVALPLLIKKAPGPERRLLGDLSDEKKVLKGLGIVI
ncbi:circadian clock protein KaiB [Arcticibacter pallidicorallinus]|uniref:Circadian clock protein KaiB n=1 Tax=Arcticibacter pallidicorallinus TaxID=1259464 RepID=A0A2T0UBV6_9SPHI|nr:circadian clock KaiB family protein [Arcticibacter pallidicorallinus]PRY55399.1 circadian clock protein KaiB [Arcticibacter pallidicorallinus]